MKKYQVYPILMVVIFLQTVACDDFLDKGPEENLSIEQAFAERAYVERWLNNIYMGIPNEMNFHETNTTFNPYIGGSDEMEVSAEWAIPNKINQSSMSSADNYFVWWNTSILTRKCNLFLNNIHLTPMSNDTKNEWIGEVHFLRGFFNFLALRMYGAIPKYDHLYDIQEDFSTIERATFEECVEFIVSDCEEAYKRLPVRQDINELGRAIAVSAYALKSRVLLYAASPLYNGNPDYASMVNKAGERIYPDYSRDRWIRAANAAKECIDFCERNGYKLYEASSGDPVDSHYELFVNNWNEEVLFARNIGINNFFEMYMLPLQHSGANTYAPTQQMIDSYRMNDGQHPFNIDNRGEVTYDTNGQPTVNPGSNYVESGFAVSANPSGYWNAGVSNMYVNREPRFYAHINFAGSVWKNKTCEFWYTGLDGLQIGQTNYCKTGYLIRKFLERYSDVLTGRYSYRSWIFFRLGEIYLNYVEALNESSDQIHPDVYTYLNNIRRRGGLPDVTANLLPNEMRLLIRQERRVEFAFESHRFFDVRRWKIAEYTDNRVIYGLNISEGTNVSDPVFYQRTPVETRKFIAPRNYLFPIEKNEIEKAPSILQNPGYY
jgi:hypothetical protein